MVMLRVLDELKEHPNWQSSNEESKIVMFCTFVDEDESAIPYSQSWKWHLSNVICNVEVETCTPSWAIFEATTSTRVVLVEVIIPVYALETVTP